MSEIRHHLLDDPAPVADARLGTWLRAREGSPYRKRQIRGHVFDRRTLDPGEMTNLPVSLRRDLAGDLLFPILETERRVESVDRTRKYGFRLRGRALVESVWIPAAERGTLCVSSQAGCPAGCTFCATAAGGYLRNLHPSEILAQWLAVDRDVAAAGLGRVSQIVFMGMGEPLLNYDAVKIALETLTSSGGFGFSPRRVTVSTVGIASRMQQLIDDFPQIRLAVSLHSAVESTRTQLVPVNRKFGLNELRRVLGKIRGESRRVTLEYVLLTGVNDLPAEAEALAAFARETAGHINLLPFHPFPGAPFPPTTTSRLREFKERVLRAGYGGRVTLRKSRGLDIQGACGQLALPADAQPSKRS